MSKSNQKPTLSDLYHLRERIELDNSVPMGELYNRDRKIGKECHADNDEGRLLFWLQNLPSAKEGGSGGSERVRDEASVAKKVCIVVLILGIVGMSSFLLVSGRGFVNVFEFLFFFVFIQALFCAFSIWIMCQSLRGSPPVILPVNLARFVLSWIYPDKQRFFSEHKSVVRLLLLRYSHGMGAMFTFGAVVAFFVVLFFSDITFVWESTFNVSNHSVKGFADFLATPWSCMCPAATVSMETVVESRHYPALTGLDEENIERMRGWWLFLVMSMLVYAMFPRLILWGVSRILYAKEVRKSFFSYPGTERILERMKSPIVSTQAKQPERPNDAGLFPGSDQQAKWSETPNEDEARKGSYDRRLILVDWACALDSAGKDKFEEFRKVPPENVIAAGTKNSPAEDVEHVRKMISSRQKSKGLMVVVKSRESPMGDLQDFISSLGISRCTICLMPFGKSVSSGDLREWTRFSRELPPDVEVIALQRH